MASGGGDKGQPPDVLTATMEAMRLKDDKGPAPPSASSLLPAPGSVVEATKQKKGGEKQAISYAAERVIGNGSFGVVYQATVIETGETVAIKKVLQDRRFKNRELQIMGMLDHPDVVTLKH